MTKAELLASIKRDRTALDALLARVSDTRMTDPVLDAGWSVKDVLAHITAWEQLCLKWLRTGVREELTAGDEFGTQVNALNARLYAENRAHALDAVRAAYARSYDEIVTATEALSDDQLAEKPAWAPHASLWQIVSANSDEHYREHIEQISRWLASDAG
ncbi:MAG: ClbS/DfsB family four-helix bundle protein [Chloroflexi bacterium]|nr:ClbS/DfsB family four-helix bundle protein [Chloroflexota bacterium]